MVARVIACNGDEVAVDDAIAQIAKELVDTSHPLHVESLLDALVAIFHDCNLPILKRIRSVEMFITKYEPIVNRLIDHRMNVHNFSMIKIIGRGACGEVQLVRHRRTQKVFAMKRLDKSEVIRRYDFSFFWEERDIMAHSNSEWIVQMYYSFQDLRYLYMVMEFMPGGDLVNLISREEITEDWARFYIAELVLALEALHGLGYIHRDVKPDNMLVSASGHIKLADFGTCLKLNEDRKIKCATAAGTPDYISPEVLNSQCSESVYGIEVDFWSVGIILYELIFGDPPFYADSLVNTYARIQNFAKELKFPTDVAVSDGAKDIIKRFLSAADTRLGANGAAEVKAHAFFKNDKWSFETIRSSDPPFIPQLLSDDDTSNFEEVTPADQNPGDSFQIPKAFNGAHLSFIGFTYANEFSPALSLELQTAKSKELPIVLNSNQTELLALKEQKTKLESAVQSLQSEKNRLESRFNSLKEEHYTAQSLVNFYKSELNETRTVISEFERKQDEMMQRARTDEEHLRAEQIAQRIADQNLNELERTKRLMEGEMESFMRRVEQAEAQNKQLQEALNKARDDNRMGPPSTRSNTGPVIHHQADRSSDSLSNSVSTTSLNDLEGLNRDQLLVRCRREIAMKQAAVEKLATLGTMKGIETEHRTNRTKADKKQRAELKRQRELWEQKHLKERQDWRKREGSLEQELDQTRVFLQDEMNKNMSLKQQQHEMERQLNYLRKELPPEVVRHIANGMYDCVSKKKRLHKLN